MSRLQKALFLSDKGYADLKKAIFACTLTNLAMLLPFCVTVMIFSEILTPFVSGGSIQWNHIWMLWGAGIVSAILVFLAAKNDYRKTYIASYKESNTTRLRIAEHLRKLPMNFFNTKDLSELTTNMMADTLHERGHTPAALAGSRRGRPWVSDHAWDVLVSSKNPPKKQGTGKQQMRCLSIPL